MGKSIRSKSKRKNRAEFRATIGEAAFQEQQKKIQENLKKTIESQTFKSLDKLSSLLQPDEEEENANNNNNSNDATEMAIDQDLKPVPLSSVVQSKNKAPVKRTRNVSKKHSLKGKSKKKRSKRR